MKLKLRLLLRFLTEMPVDVKIRLLRSITLIVIRFNLKNTRTIYTKIGVFIVLGTIECKNSI